MPPSRGRLAGQMAGYRRTVHTSSRALSQGCTVPSVRRLRPLSRAVAGDLFKPCKFLHSDQPRGRCARVATGTGGAAGDTGSVEVT